MLNLKKKPTNTIFFVYPVSIEKEIKNLKTRSPRYWTKKGEDMMLRLFTLTNKTVPAYRDFLVQQGFDSKKVQTFKDIAQIPCLDKHSYIKKYPLPSLLPLQDISQISTFSSTSGSTGEPVYFPRGEMHDSQYEYIAEILMKNQFNRKNKRTLGIIGFGLGIWIGGIFTYKNFNRLSMKGHSLSIAPVGTDKKIFLKTFAALASHFDQILLMGYPPFIKDVLDEGADYGIDWKKNSIKILTATESYSENFRDYMSKKVGMKEPLADIVNIYGTVELGTMAHETPFTNLIRKIAAKNKKVFRKIFPDTTLLPTLAQYYPHLTYFEEVDGELIASGFGSAYPLMRYRLHDKGGVILFDEMVRKLKEAGVDILAEAKRDGVLDMIMKLPFVYVFERSDFVVVLRGANIYPENVKVALQSAELEDAVTGKFTMIKKENAQFEEYLEINIEMQKHSIISEAFQKKVTQIIVDALRRDNSEYNYLYTHEGKKLTPDVRLFAYEFPEFFAPNIKQKWVKK